MKYTLQLTTLAGVLLLNQTSNQILEGQEIIHKITNNVYKLSL
jgi:hypothetical protein